MSGSTRSRQKRKLEPISLEELAGTTGMSGFCTFLTRDASVAVPALDHLQELEPGALHPSAPEVHAPELAAPVITESPADIPTAPVMNASGSSAPELDAAALEESAAVDWSAPDTSASPSPALEIYSRRRVRIREASTVQDGHSLAEQAVYDAMYRAGKQIG